jgi:hypothetical protein
MSNIWINSLIGNLENNASILSVTFSLLVTIFSPSTLQNFFLDWDRPRSNSLDPLSTSTLSLDHFQQQGCYHSGLLHKRQTFDFCLIQTHSKIISIWNQIKVSLCQYQKQCDLPEACSKMIHQTKCWSRDERSKEMGIAGF